MLTGAGGAVGHAAARAFALEGARLVLAARPDESLGPVADACRSLGTDVLAVPADVRDERDVQRLASLATREFGRIDTWVNGAGVISAVRREDVTGPALLAAIETNVIGQIHAARSVLPQFRRQGQGVMINVSAIWGRVSSPHAAPYVTARFAVRALTERLRHEVRDTAGVAIAVIVPGVDDAAAVADAIVGCARSPRPELADAGARRTRERLQPLTAMACRCLIPPGLVVHRADRDVQPSATWRPGLLGRRLGAARARTRRYSR